MVKKPINVLVVDDSSFMRKAIKTLIEEDDELKVVDVARDGREAVEKVEKVNPDVVTMDVEMPRMNGLEALRVIMKRHPVPVLMVSSLTEAGAKATFEALDMGAVDFVPKHLDDLSVNIVKIKSDLIEKIKAVAGKSVSVPCTRKVSVEPMPVKDWAELPSKDRFVSQRVAIVAIGASTGGPRAVQDILKAIPGNFPSAILVVQHMPRGFTSSYAEKLNRLCNIKVKEAADGDIIRAGEAFIAPGGMQTTLKKKGALEVEISVETGPADAIYKPCVDISLLSVSECFPGRALGVIMTGMGADGREGIRKIKAEGGKTIAQDESSCVVYGMPKAVVDEGLADKVVPLEKMSGEIVNMV